MVIFHRYLSKVWLRGTQSCSKGPLGPFISAGFVCAIPAGITVGSRRCLC